MCVFFYCFASGQTTLCVSLCVFFFCILGLNFSRHIFTDTITYGFSCLQYIFTLTFGARNPCPRWFLPPSLSEGEGTNFKRLFLQHCVVCSCFFCFITVFVCVFNEFCFDRFSFHLLLVLVVSNDFFLSFCGWQLRVLTECTRHTIHSGTTELPVVVVVFFLLLNHPQISRH